VGRVVLSFIDKLSYLQRMTVTTIIVSMTCSRGYSCPAPRYIYGRLDTDTARGFTVQIFLQNVQLVKRFEMFLELTISWLTHPAV
jgi:hypothetical protein